MEKLIDYGVSQGGGQPSQESCAVSIPACFEDHTGLNAEQPDVTSW